MITPWEQTKGTIPNEVPWHLGALLPEGILLDPHNIPSVFLADDMFSGCITWMMMETGKYSLTRLLSGCEMTG